MALSNKDARNLSCGAIAGAVSRTAVSPLERLKILYQTQYVAGHTAKGPAKYEGMVSSLAKIFREEGFRGFYKGNGVNVFRVIPYVGTQFMCFDKYKKICMSVRHPGDAAANLLPVEKLCVGASAGATSVMVTYPMDLVRGKLTVQGGVVNTQYRGMVDCARQTVAEGGVAALYRGMTPNMIGIMPYVGINYLTYETIKEYAPVAPGETLPHPGYLAIAAGIAGTTGQTVAYP